MTDTEAHRKRETPVLPKPGRSRPEESDHYCLITPARNEAKYLRRSIESVLAQTVLPSLWVFVDDGSADATPGILAEYSAQIPWLEIVHREDRGHRSVGPGVIEAFYAGLDATDLTDLTYLCKFDADLEVPRRYFEILIQRMKEDPRLGTCSGMAYFEDAKSGALTSEKLGFEMSIGASKFYRLACFEEIGGFVSEVMWDGIDCHRCRMLGWKAGCWDEPDLRFTHMRPMGASDSGILKGRMRHGYGQYFMGTGLAYMMASAVYRMGTTPYILGGAAMWWGYVLSMWKRNRRYSDPEFRRYLRRYQFECLRFGKKEAVRRAEQRGRSSRGP